MTAITVYAPGHYDIADSYGLIACQLARHLTALGVHVNAVGMGNTVMDTQPEDIRAVTSRPIRPSLGGILLGYPTGFDRFSTLAQLGPRVAVTMFESSKLPPAWAPILNELDAVVVPSRFCRTVFRDSGVTAPIHVVPLGIGEVYKYAERPTDRPLTFLAFLDRGARKGGLAALQAFLMAFGEDMNYRLILKGRKAKVPLELTNPNITVIQQDMSEQELYELYLQADVLINPNKGEGFGLIPREFAATGGIACATGWGGTVDNINDWGVWLPYELEPADWKGVKSLAGFDLGEWAKPDIDGVAETLIHVAKDIDWYRARSQRRANNAVALYSWRKFAEQVLSIWKEAAVGYSNRLSTAA